MKSKWIQKSLSLIAKVAILGLSLIFLFKKVDINTFESLFNQSFDYLIPTTIGFIILWALNISLDALFWTKIQRMLEPVKLIRGFKINLICYALAFITPAQSGEWVGRYIMMNETTNRKKSFFLNFWMHLPKLFSKIFFSVLAGAVVIVSFDWLSVSAAIPLVILGWSIVIGLYFSLKKLQNWLYNKSFRSLKLENYLLEGRPTHKEKGLFLVLASSKFLTYNIQFALVLLLFSESELPIEIWFTIPLYYLVSAIIPTFAFVDFILKSAIAVWIFQPVTDNESLLILASLILWVFNVVIPAFIGLFFILKANLYQSFKMKFQLGNRNDS